MNERFRTILRTAWNEPRHFFLWLALLSVCGLAASAVLATLAGPALLLTFLALGCGLCFLVCLPAFILAWIPPVRRLFAWLLGRRFCVLGCLVTLVALFYAIENWRGRRAWQDFKREREAKGERFDLASFIPPTVPNDQNFFETPLFSDLHFAETNRMSDWNDTPGHSRVIFDVFGPKGNNAPSPGGWPKAQRVDLAAWQTFYRGSNNVFAADETAAAPFRRRYGMEPAAAPSADNNSVATNNPVQEAFRRRYGLAPDLPPKGPTTNYFPITKAPQTPAVDVLLALSRFETNRQLLIAAAARPQARFWINYDAGNAMLLPHLARLKGSAQYLSLHATAALKAGDKATALQDVQLLFRLVASIQREPNLISQLVRFSLLAIALQPVWEGLADRAWTESDLRTIESELGKLDYLADYHFAMRGERACNVWGVDYIRKRGMEELEEMAMVGSPINASGPAEWEKLLGKATFRLIPAGWFDQNKVSICRIYEQCLLPLVAQEDRRLAPQDSTQRFDAVLGTGGWQPFNRLARILLPGLVGIVEKAAYAQSCADLARVACALERFRLASGPFPDTLDALVPKFIEKLPHDVINGQPLRYLRADDGLFVLYSIGLNETDDGGKVGWTKSGNADMRKGDWVWRYPDK
jgi:hypothetical protein